MASLTIEFEGLSPASSHLSATTAVASADVIAPGELGWVLLEIACASPAATAGATVPLDAWWHVVQQASLRIFMLVPVRAWRHASSSFLQGGGKWASTSFLSPVQSESNSKNRNREETREHYEMKDYGGRDASCSLTFRLVTRATCSSSSLVSPLTARPESAYNVKEPLEGELLHGIYQAVPDPCLFSFLSTYCTGQEGETTTAATRLLCRAIIDDDSSLMKVIAGGVSCYTPLRIDSFDTSKEAFGQPFLVSSASSWVELMRFVSVWHAHVISQVFGICDGGDADSWKSMAAAPSDTKRGQRMKGKEMQLRGAVMSLFEKIASPSVARESAVVSSGSTVGVSGDHCDVEDRLAIATACKCFLFGLKCRAEGLPTLDLCTASPDGGDHRGGGANLVMPTAVLLISRWASFLAYETDLLIISSSCHSPPCALYDRRGATHSGDGTTIATGEEGLSPSHQQPQQQRGITEIASPLYSTAFISHAAATTVLPPPVVSTGSSPTAMEKEKEAEEAHCCGVFGRGKSTYDSNGGGSSSQLAKMQEGGSSGGVFIIRDSTTAGTRNAPVAACFEGRSSGMCKHKYIRPHVPEGLFLVAHEARSSSRRLASSQTLSRQQQQKQREEGEELKPLTSSSPLPPATLRPGSAESFVPELHRILSALYRAPPPPAGGGQWWSSGVPLSPGAGARSRRTDTIDKGENEAEGRRSGKPREIRALLSATSHCVLRDQLDRIAGDAASALFPSVALLEATNQLPYHLTVWYYGYDPQADHRTRKHRSFMKGYTQSGSGLVGVVKVGLKSLWNAVRTSSATHKISAAVAAAMPGSGTTNMNASSPSATSPPAASSLCFSLSYPHGCSSGGGASTTTTASSTGGPPAAMRDASLYDSPCSLYITEQDIILRRCHAPAAARQEEGDDEKVMEAGNDTAAHNTRRKSSMRELLLVIPRVSIVGLTCCPVQRTGDGVLSDANLKRKLFALDTEPCPSSSFGATDATTTGAPAAHQSSPPLPPSLPSQHQQQQQKCKAVPWPVLKHVSIKPYLQGLVPRGGTNIKGSTSSNVVAACAGGSASMKTLTAEAAQHSPYAPPVVPTVRTGFLSNSTGGGAATVLLKIETQSLRTVWIEFADQQTLEYVYELLQTCMQPSRASAVSSAALGHAGSAGTTTEADMMEDGKMPGSRRFLGGPCQVPLTLSPHAKHSSNSNSGAARHAAVCSASVNNTSSLSTHSLAASWVATSSTLLAANTAGNRFLASARRPWPMVTLVLAASGILPASPSIAAAINFPRGGSGGSGGGGAGPVGTLFAMQFLKNVAVASAISTLYIESSGGSDGSCCCCCRQSEVPRVEERGSGMGPQCEEAVDARGERRYGGDQSHTPCACGSRVLSTGDITTTTTTTTLLSPLARTWWLFDPAREYSRQSLSPDLWSLSDVNFDYQFCASYPAVFPVPARMAASLQQGRMDGKHRTSSRIEALTFMYAPTGGALVRSAQPAVVSHFMGHVASAAAAAAATPSLQGEWADEKRDERRRGTGDAAAHDMFGAAAVRSRGSASKRKGATTSRHVAMRMVLDALQRASGPARGFAILDLRSALLANSNTLRGGGAMSWWHGGVEYANLPNIHSVREMWRQLRNTIQESALELAPQTGMFVMGGEPPLAAVALAAETGGAGGTEVSTAAASYSAGGGGGGRTKGGRAPTATASRSTNEGSNVDAQCEDEFQQQQQQQQQDQWTCITHALLNTAVRAARRVCGIPTDPLYSPALAVGGGGGSSEGTRDANVFSHIVAHDFVALTLAPSLFPSPPHEAMDSVREPWMKRNSPQKQFYRQPLASYAAEAHSALASVLLINCTDGWDRTSQVSALTQVLCDPYCRTVEGLCVLIEKDFVAFGHPTLKRSAGIAGNRNACSSSSSCLLSSSQRQQSSGEGSDNGMVGHAAHRIKKESKLDSGSDTRLSSTTHGDEWDMLEAEEEEDEEEGDVGSVPTSPAASPSPPQRAAAASSSSKAEAAALVTPASKELPSDFSPILLQFFDCLRQLVQLYPACFEYTEIFLLLLVDLMHAGLISSFCVNCEADVVRDGVQVGCMSLGQWCALLLATTLPSPPTLPLHHSVAERERRTEKKQGKTALNADASTWASTSSLQSHTSSGGAEEMAGFAGRSRGGGLARRNSEEKRKKGRNEHQVRGDCKGSIDGDSDRSNVLPQPPQLQLQQEIHLCAEGHRLMPPSQDTFAGVAAAAAGLAHYSSMGSFSRIDSQPSVDTDGVAAAAATAAAVSLTSCTPEHVLHDGDRGGGSGSVKSQRVEVEGACRGARCRDRSSQYDPPVMSEGTFVGAHGEAFGTPHPLSSAPQVTVASVPEQEEAGERKELGDVESDDDEEEGEYRSAAAEAITMFDWSTQLPQHPSNLNRAPSSSMHTSRNSRDSDLYRSAAGARSAASGADLTFMATQQYSQHALRSSTYAATSSRCANATDVTGVDGEEGRSGEPARRPNFDFQQRLLPVSADAMAFSGYLNPNFSLKYNALSVGPLVDYIPLSHVTTWNSFFSRHSFWNERRTQLHRMAPGAVQRGQYVNAATGRGDGASSMIGGGGEKGHSNVAMMSYSATTVLFASSPAEMEGSTCAQSSPLSPNTRFMATSGQGGSGDRMENVGLCGTTSSAGARRKDSAQQRQSPHDAGVGHRPSRPIARRLSPLIASDEEEDDDSTLFL